MDGHNPLSAINLKTISITFMAFFLIIICWLINCAAANNLKKDGKNFPEEEKVKQDDHSVKNQGKRDGPCYPNHTCENGLTCLKNKCLYIDDFWN